MFNVVDILYKIILSKPFLFSVLLFQAPVFDTDGPGSPVNHSGNLQEDMTLPLCIFTLCCTGVGMQSWLHRGTVELARDVGWRTCLSAGMGYATVHRSHFGMAVPAN